MKKRNKHVVIDKLNEPTSAEKGVTVQGVFIGLSTATSVCVCLCVCVCVCT